jgi:hypothetical protein
MHGCLKELGSPQPGSQYTQKGMSERKCRGDSAQVRGVQEVALQRHEQELQTMRQELDSLKGLRLMPQAFSQAEQMSSLSSGNAQVPVVTLRLPKNTGQLQQASHLGHDRKKESGGWNTMQVCGGYKQKNDQHVRFYCIIA